MKRNSSSSQEPDVRKLQDSRMLDFSPLSVESQITWYRAVGGHFRLRWPPPSGAFTHQYSRTARTVNMALSMKVTLALLLVVVVGASLAQRQQISDDTLEMALKDKRYFERQLKCALGEGACDPVGRRLKTFAPLVLRGACPQCSDQETKQIQRVLSHIQRNYPKEWSKIIQQYATGS
ncbi:ejaculatory bulb-specific protein 3-like isoform X1 [Homalodisca vitripennis]|uniref:ejaculatory bulb-specific protein 3-like isoform X1 n=2 Tax=Homalodisca vitripennis TaxID=197043 RepID=UPI001EEB0964|nr:ejaculatory bulb-specific protein 3-like isoform X1 [Homalodisca vitripennis]